MKKLKVKENTIEHRLATGQRIALIATVITIFLALFKGIVGHLSGSILLVTDAFHSVADVIIIFASWIGLKLVRRKPNERFNYGFYKAENIVTLFVSLIILYIAVSLFIDGFHRLFEISSISFPFLTILTASISVVVGIFLSYYEVKVGREIKSQSLLANGLESRTDIFTSLLVLIGLFLSISHIKYVEGIVTIVISLFILKISLESGKESLLSLMDVSPEPAMEQKIKHFIERQNEVVKVNSIKLRKSGPLVFGEAKVSFKQGLSFKEVSKLISLISSKIHKQGVESFTIEPLISKPKHEVILIPLSNVRQDRLKSTLSNIFARSDYYCICKLDVENKKILSITTKQNKAKTKPVRVGLAFIKSITQKVDSVIIKSIGEISFHVLRDNFIRVYKTDKNLLKDVLNSYLNNNLTQLYKPTKKSIGK